MPIHLLFDAYVTLKTVKKVRKYCLKNCHSMKDKYVVPLTFIKTWK